MHVRTLAHTNASLVTLIGWVHMCLLKDNCKLYVYIYTPMYLLFLYAYICLVETKQAYMHTLDKSA